MLDVFKGDAFGVVSLTAAINKLPVKPARLGQLGLFKRTPITTTTAAIEENGGKLSLLQTKARGAASAAATRPSGRKMRSFAVPHIPYNDEILATEVQNVRAFGSEDATETVADIVNGRLQTAKDNHEITHEYHRMGAVKGQILDADGATVIYDLFDEFGVTEETMVNEADVKLYAQKIIRMTRAKLGASPYSQIRVLCGDDFWDWLITNASVKAAFEKYQENAFARTQQLDSGFEFAGIMWENYVGKIGDVDFLGTDKARVVPMGVPDLFLEINAPANFIEAVNTPGKPFYAKQSIM